LIVVALVMRTSNDRWTSPSRRVACSAPGTPPRQPRRCARRGFRAHRRGRHVALGAARPLPRSNRWPK